MRGKGKWRVFEDFALKIKNNDLSIFKLTIFKHRSKRGPN